MANLKKTYFTRNKSLKEIVAGRQAGRQAGPGYVNETKIKESKAVFKP
jgi:hypothetical protein